MKDHIFELLRKIWRHHWSSHLCEIKAWKTIFFSGFTTVFVDTWLWKTKHPRKRFQDFRQSCVLLTDWIEIHQLQPLAWPSNFEFSMSCYWAVIGGFRTDLSITCKTDGKFGNVSVGVLFSKVAHQRKRLLFSQLLWKKLSNVCDTWTTENKLNGKLFMCLLICYPLNSFVIDLLCLCDIYI